MSDNKKQEEQTKEEKRQIKEAEAKAKARNEEKERIKKEIEEEDKEKTKARAKARDEKIKAVQKKTRKTDEDKAFLKREIITRAQENAAMPNDLNKLFPSQMSLEEMKKYCKDNKIETKKGDTTVMLRARIKAFRNPAQEERLRMLEKIPVEGKIIR